MIKPRRAARELALLTLFQLETAHVAVGGGAGLANKDPEASTPPQDDAHPNVPQEEGSRLGTLPLAFTLPNDVKRMNLEEMMVAAVRSLTDMARDQLESAGETLAMAQHYFTTMEAEHPTNLERPLEAENVPVPIPHTDEARHKLATCLQAVDLLGEALEVPLFVALAETREVKDYANQLIKLVVEHRVTLHQLIEASSEDWRLDRLAKMDRLVMELAIAEMKYLPDVDLSVSINEAVELAKRFSSEESYRFINGVLGQVATMLEGQPAHAEP
ncbi:MAG: transcription antitermination factor NusB [Candidatus Melainabacteria bacterium]|nr:transcription antitermination factor NusB [Candidatus Melainabacteria bacterium]